MDSPWSVPEVLAARSLPQLRNSPSDENRTAVVWNVRWNKAAVGPLAEERNAPGRDDALRALPRLELLPEVLLALADLLTAAVDGLVERDVRAVVDRHRVVVQLFVPDRARHTFADGSGHDGSGD